MAVIGCMQFVLAKSRQRRNDTHACPFAGVHAILAALTEIEVQAVHAASTSFGRRLLKDILSSFKMSSTG